MKFKNMDHPIARVRRAFMENGYDHIATREGFAQKVGYSSSLLRNVESGLFPFTEKLALRIQQATGVSAEWLRSEPGLDEAIIDPQGNVWSPADDPNLHLIDNMANLAELLYLKMPAHLPAFMGAVLESLLTLRPPRTGRSGSEGTEIRRPHHERRMREMRFYMEAMIFPILQMIDKLDAKENQKFPETMKRHLSGEHAVSADELLNMWDFANSQTNFLRSAGRPMSVPPRPGNDAAAEQGKSSTLPNKPSDEDGRADETPPESSSPVS